MYICICKAVTDRQLHNAIDNGICTRRQLAHCFGIGRDCGKCNKEVKEILEQRTKQASIYPMMAISNH